jgi:peptide/nickel transport system permease protein
VTALQEQAPERTAPKADWQQDLAEVGFVRRILISRRWYGPDWWFVAISALMVVGFITLAIIPSVFAPYAPDVLVGPRFLAPGEQPDLPILVVQKDSTDNQLLDLAHGPDEDRPNVGVLQGVPTAGALNQESQKIDEGLKNGSSGTRLRPRIVRFETLEATLEALQSGELTAVVVRQLEFQELADQFPGLRQGDPITGDTATAGGFLLGTNEIGQDVLSRLIWGTRIALIIGFSASIVALVLGVPLGLFAGYTSGAVDRLLSLLMDSMYAFPGLILAIAITAVLGPSVLNVIVAIAVLYVPTYYRIVRGQTLAVKEELYVDAARSLGARSIEILRLYIFPNVIPSVAIIFSVNIADAILTGAGLSFLGLGLPPTIADWGIDLARGQRFIQTAWWMITFPGLAIVLVVLAFSMMGEGLTEIFNPKLNER